MSSMKRKKNTAIAKKQYQASDVVGYCESHNIKLTPLRKNILLIVAKTKQPLTAYQILDELKQDNPKAQVMSVYRVLEYLLAHHLIHRIENLNAFMPCCHLLEKHFSQWLICETCGDTKECALPVFEQGIDQIEKHTGFSVTNPTIELLGLCSQCQQKANMVVSP